VWPNGPVCPYCGGIERINKMQGKTTWLGLYKSVFEKGLP
jgi:hypothetical protein